MRHSLKCISFNARSLCNKLVELQYVLSSNEIDVACITETWLSNYISNSVIVPVTDFNIYRKDRDGRGGGVCIIVKSSVTYSVLPVSLPDCYSKLEIVCIDLVTGPDANSGVRIICVYLTPGFAKQTENCRFLSDALTFLINTDLPICILGDFNLPGTDWSSCSSSDNDDYYSLDNFFIVNFFSQLVNFPTRNENILDLIFTDNMSLVTNVRPDLPLASSDHASISFNINLCSYLGDEPSSESNFDAKNDFKGFSYYDLEKTNWPKVCDILSNIDWLSIFNVNSNDVTYCWNEFYYIVLHAISIYAPAKSSQMKLKRFSITDCMHTGVQSDVVVAVRLTTLLTSGSSVLRRNKHGVDLEK